MSHIITRPLSQQTIRTLTSPNNMRAIKCLIENSPREKKSNKDNEERILNFIDRYGDKYGNLSNIVLEQAVQPAFLDFFIRTIETIDSENSKKDRSARRSFEPLAIHLAVSHAQSYSSDQQLVLIGGWATFMTIHALSSDNAFITWRGSDDIDAIATNMSMLNIFTIGTNPILDRYGLSIERRMKGPDYYQCEVKSDAYPEAFVYHIYTSRKNEHGPVVVGDSELKKEDITSTSVQIVRDMPIMIINPLLLIKLKLEAGRQKDYFDIECVTNCLLEIISRDNHPENYAEIQRALIEINAFARSSIR